jgi:hypothetical protein
MQPLALHARIAAVCFGSAVPAAGLRHSACAPAAVLLTRAVPPLLMRLLPVALFHPCTCLAPLFALFTHAHAWSAAGAMRHQSEILALMDSWSADIITLVEVESCPVLESLVKEGRSKQLATEQMTGYLTVGTDIFTGQDVALLTRCAPSIPVAAPALLMCQRLLLAGNSGWHSGARCAAGYEGSRSTAALSRARRTTPII